MITVLRNGTYRALFFAQVIALVGTGLLTVALGLLAFEIAGDAAGSVLGTALTIKMVMYVVIAPIAGAYADRQDFYRAGLAALDAYCWTTHKAPFAKLDAARQDAVIKELEGNKATGFTWPSAAAFFNTLRTHTMEGMFADPVYGGNKDFAGWRLVGFPGAQVLFTEAEMHSKDAFTRGPVLGLQSQLAVKKG
mgnify:CR=1 FL=1